MVRKKLVGGTPTGYLLDGRVRPDFVYVWITHWFPILTFCPYNGLPDFVFVTVKFHQFRELYAVRKKIKELIQFQTLYMEDVARIVKLTYTDALEVEVRLMFSKHVVRINYVPLD